MQNFNNEYSVKSIALISQSLIELLLNKQDYV